MRPWPPGPRFRPTASCCTRSPAGCWQWEPPSSASSSATAVSTCAQPTNPGRLAALAGLLPADLTGWVGRELYTPCFQVKVAGTTGAGDCAYAGLLAGLLYGQSVEAVLLSSAATGACSVERADATSGVPHWDDVQARLRAGWARHPHTLQLAGWHEQRRRHHLVWPDRSDTRPGAQRMSEPYLLGIDLGTSSLKVLVVGLDGRVAASGSAEYPILHAQPLHAEQDPHAWWEACVQAVRAALASVPGPGDRRHRPLRPDAWRRHARPRAAAGRTRHHLAGPAQPAPGAGDHRARGGRAAVRHHRQPSLHRLSGCQRALDAAGGAGYLGAGADAAAAQGLPALAHDRRLCHRSQ